MEVFSRLLELPEPADSKKKQEKRWVKEPDLGLLTPQQRQVFDKLVERIDSPESNLTLLKGYAGTGKTFLIAMFVEWFLYNRKGKRVALTAPTNKAVKVQKSAADYQDPNLYYATIHGLLGLREQIDGYGRQKFVQVNKNDASVEDYFLVVVDESSMLADELFDLLVPYTDYHNLKILFVGDPAQIPPVGKSDSIPFMKAQQEQYQIECLELTDIVRQSVDNPIIRTTMKVREFLGRDIVIPTRDDCFDERNMDGVFFFDVEKKDQFYSIIKHYFTSENFKRDADFMKIVAFTNKTVNTFNKIVRHFIYGKGVGKICVGEKLIADGPIKNEEDIILFSTNDEFEVVSFTDKEIMYQEVPFRYYDTVVVQTGLYGDVTKQIKILHESSEEDYQLIIEHLKELALAEKRGSWEAARQWEKYFRFQEVFAPVKYNYAITAHKAQGSTFSNCMVLEADIDIQKKIRDRNRIKYTAFTRPKHRLFVVY